MSFALIGPELEEFDKRDIERVHQDDAYVELFFNHKHGDMEKALEMMVKKKFD